MVRDDHLAEVTLAIFLLFHESCVLQLMECCNVYNDNRCVPLQRMPRAMITPKSLKKAIGEAHQASLCHTIWHVLTLSELCLRS